MRYFIFCLLLLSTTAYASKLYQWVDEEGVTHYTQTPPPSHIYAEERTINSPKPQQEPSAEENPENADPLQDLKAVRAENCHKSRENLAKLTSNQELVSVATGDETPEELANMKPMSLEEREQEIARVQDFINEFCQNVPVQEEKTEQAEQE